VPRIVYNYSVGLNASSKYIFGPRCFGSWLYLRHEVTKSYTVGPPDRTSPSLRLTRPGGPTELTSCLSPDGRSRTNFRNDVACQNIWTIYKIQQNNYTPTHLHTRFHESETCSKTYTNIINLFPHLNKLRSTLLVWYNLSLSLWVQNGSDGCWRPGFLQSHPYCYVLWWGREWELKLYQNHQICCHSPSDLQHRHSHALALSDTTKHFSRHSFWVLGFWCTECTIYNVTKNNHVLRYRNEIRCSFTPCNRLSQPTPSHSSQCYPGC
jgi:hypothetical protein